MKITTSILTSVRTWYASSTIGRSNTALAKSEVRQETSAKIIASHRQKMSPIDDYIWGAGKPRD